MTLTLEQLVGQKLMWSFQGKDAPPAEFLSALKQGQVSGVSLFRPFNVDDPAQVRRLTDQLQHTAKDAGLPLLLIAVDQEGGQLMGLGDQTTPFPGSMALGATRSVDLAFRVGYAIGREVAAMGVNVNFSPVCDVNLNPQNPVIGTRSFGESPELVASLAAATVKGLQAAGVAATAKHFPGHGDTASDSHYGTPTITHPLERLQEVEFPPFAAAIDAGAQLVMTAHIAVPSLNHASALLATLSSTILRKILRGELKFDGVITTDAMDMRAVMPKGSANIASVSVEAAVAGADLLLLTSFVDQSAIYAALLAAARSGQFSKSDLDASTRRIAALKHWIATQPDRPALDVVGCAEHHALAAEVAERSITLVRDEAHLLPLHLAAEDRVAVIIPQPMDLTPADTSSYVVPALASELRKRHTAVDQFMVPIDPSESEAAGLISAIRSYNLVIVGTINAIDHAGQAALVNQLIASGLPTIAVALRLPYDLQAYPGAPTYLCTYGILDSSMKALARAVLGEISCSGQLPVSIAGPYPIGHGLNSALAIRNESTHE